MIFPQEFPARISSKIFPQDFSARFPRKNFPQDFPELDPDWLAPHHPIPNAKFPPITALLNRPTYHKRSKVSPPPFPKSYGNPKSMNKLTLNEPAIILAEFPIKNAFLKSILNQVPHMTHQIKA